MKIGRVYTPAIFIVRGTDPSTKGIGVQNEYWEGAHPSNIHHRGIHPLVGGIGAGDEYWKWVHPSNIHLEGYRVLNTGYRGTR